MRISRTELLLLLGFTLCLGVVLGSLLHRAIS
jgi:hypothetical protein